ncbi:amino acid permease [Candidatus Dependentiae bacterium]|nr:amino acid permease [Candidatus Dependentiae bacterium]
MKLKRKLTFIDIFSIASGAMISSGLFILPGLAHAKAGPAVFVSYLLAAFLAGTGMLSQAELVSAMPKAGGTYFYVKRSMGPAVGTVDGLLTWFSLSLKSSLALVGMAYFTAMILPVDIRIIGVALCIFFVFLNIVGVKEAGIFQVGLVVGLFGILLFYIVRGLPAINVMNFKDYNPHGWGAIFSTAGFVFVSYGGLLKVASVAEEVKKPGKTIPLAMIFSLLTVSILYALVIFVTTGVLSPETFNNSLAPISDGAGAFLGKAGVIALSIAAILAFVSTANAGIMAASRYPFALSRDGLLPEFFSRISKKFHTPHIAIIITGFFMILSLFLRLKILVEAASTVLILTYTFSCFSVIIMRESRLQNYRPKFKSPLYPYIQIIGIIGFGFMLFKIGTDAIFISLILILFGLFSYWFYGRIRATRESAILHLVQRITARELVTGTLESELKEIIRERDDIINDRFDHLIEDCPVIDIEETIPVEDFLKIVAEELTDKLQKKEKILYNLLIKREEEGSTVLMPGLAIPHIIIEGEKVFQILLARCKNGIKFPEATKKVTTIFVLVGTRDERNFHLKALSAIAQIVQNPHFEKRWREAKSKQGLKDILLLGKRRRLN